VERILITGSEGFVGRNLVKKIGSITDNFFTMDKIDNGKENHLCLDLSDSNLIEHLKLIRPSIIVHLAAQTDVRYSMEYPHEDLRINAVGTLNLLKASIMSGCDNFLYINSGGAIYSSSEAIPFSETSAICPDSAYGATKQLCEEYVRIFCDRAGVRWKSLALSNVYGSVLENKKGIFYEAWRALTSNQTFKIYGAGVTRDYVHVSDVVDAILASLSSDEIGRFNIGTGIETTNLEVFSLMKDKIQSNSTYQLENQRYGEVARSALDISKAKIRLKWNPKISIVDGISKII
jgi:UDP-glucose 4-epimerase